MLDADGTLPGRIFRNESAYRSAPRGPARGAVDCGFLLKPGPGRGYHHRALPGYVAVYVLRGQGLFVDAAGRRHRVEAGCVAQHLPGRAHSLVPDPDGRWAEFFFILPAEFHRTLARLGGLRDEPVLRPGLEPALIERCEALMDEVRAAPPHRAAAALARGHDLLVALHRAHDTGRRPAGADLVARACEWLADPEQDHDARDIARRLSLSYERFRKLFRQRMGLAPGEYRIRRRIDRARRLIAEHGLSNKEVAYRLGYADPFTFSKQFKRYTGVSPATFRRTV